MSFENFQQNFANATGLIVDRTVEPPLVLGQAFVVSKSRAVTCASCVFNYAEAPWALAVNFPHPDLVLGLKSIALHPDFDKKEARGRYLSQTGLPDESGNAQLNDLATLVLDATLQPLQQEKVAEMHRALTLPFSNVGVEASGAITDGDFLSLVNSVLESGREGLLTLFDAFNIPVARIKIDAGKISKVYYKTLVNEMAFSEMVYRKPAKGFAFQPQGSVKWEDIRDISVPTVNLVGESNRRASEIPNLISRLGGGGSRYQKAVQQFDSGATNENIRWLVERLWLALDGYITVDKLPERIGADTYSVAQGLRELANRGVVSLLNRATPFAGSGQLGTPLVSHTDFDINPGDPLTAFYLDPLSGAPNWRQGNFNGVSSVLQPKNLLHTIQIPAGTPGALILKNYKLVGVHNGAMQPKPGQAPSDNKLYQMMWIGALLDMSTKRLREGEGRQGEPAMAGLRTRLDIEQPEEAAAQAAKLDKFICPSCYSTNTKVGPCFNCGTIIEPPEPEPEVTGLMGKPPFKQLMALKKQYNVTNKQLAIAGSIVVGLPLFGMMFCGGPSPSTHAPEQKTETVGHHSSEAAVRTAVQYAGFKGTAPPGYWYEDTSEITKPNKSFGLYSEPSNQKVMFVVFDDMSPVQNLNNFIQRPLFTDAKNLIGTQELDKNPNVSTGKEIIGTGDLTYLVGHYETGGNPDVPILIGSFPSKATGKSILVVGQALSNDTPYDSKSTIFLIDEMAEQFTKDGNRQRMGVAATPPSTPKTGQGGSETKSGEVAFATDEQIAEFLGKVREKLQDKLSLPKQAADELKKKKSKKLKTTVSVGIDNDGNVKKIDITEPSEWDKINDAVVKDINSQAPYKDAPKTKDGLLTFMVYLKKDQLSVELP
jgi:hypothetical protein